jgi:hypothetical protein
VSERSTWFAGRSVRYNTARPVSRRRYRFLNSALSLRTEGMCNKHEHWGRLPDIYVVSGRQLTCTRRLPATELSVAMWKQIHFLSSALPHLSCFSERAVRSCLGYLLQCRLPCSGQVASALQDQSDIALPKLGSRLPVGYLPCVQF